MGSFLQLPLDVVGNRRCLFADIGYSDNFPIAPFGEWSHRPKILAGTAGFADIQSDPEVIRLYLPGVEQAAEQRIFRMGDRMERTRAVERESKIFRSRLARTAPPIIHRKASARFMSANDLACCNFEAPFANQKGERLRHFGSDAVAVDIPPRPRMTQEALLLLSTHRLPQRMAVRAKTVYGSAPAHLSAAPP